MGRRPHTEEERAAARQAAKEKTRNITVDADLVEAMREICERLEAELGFRPTISQALRWLIKHAAK